MNTPFKKYPSISSIDVAEELGLNKLPPKPTPPPLLMRTSKLFLKGPIPFDWLKKANALGGSTGIVATGLWLYVGINGSRRFKVDSKLDQFAGVARQTRQNALQKLERAGLIELSQRHGAYPFVKVLTGA